MTGNRGRGVSFWLAREGLKKYLSHFIPRNFLEISGTLPLKSLMRFLRASRGNPGTTGFSPWGSINSRMLRQFFELLRRRFHPCY